MPTAATSRDATPRLRCIRLIAPELGARFRADPAAMAAWIKRNVPAGIGRDSRWIWPCPDHAAKAKRFADFLFCAEAARLAAPRARRLLLIAFEQAGRFDAWHASGRADAARDDQTAQADMLRRTEALAKAARDLAQHFASTHGAAATPLRLAARRIAESLDLPGENHPDAEGGPTTGLRWIWDGWRREEGDAPGAPLARLLDAFAEEVLAFEPHGVSLLQRGPWVFPERVDKRHSLPSDATAAAFMVSALARGSGLDWPLALDGRGRAHWPLAAAYARDLTGAEMTAREAQEQVSRLLKRQPGLRFQGWPMPDGDTSPPRLV